MLQSIDILCRWFSDFVIYPNYMAMQQYRVNTDHSIQIKAIKQCFNPSKCVRNGNLCSDINGVILYLFLFLLNARCEKFRLHVIWNTTQCCELFLWLIFFQLSLMFLVQLNLKMWIEWEKSIISFKATRIHTSAFHFQ